MGRALVFPGQGAQTVGMGRDLAEAYAAARAVFDEVDEALGVSLSRLIWDGPAEDLTLTANAQPALMATSLAAMRALEAEGFDWAEVDSVAGHSLGEYSALAAAGALSLGDAARLLRARGEAMQAAVPVGVGAMAAILGLDLEAVRALAAEAASDGRVCTAANDNDPAQVVISGHADAVARAVERASARGAKRAVMLPVSAPFHCSLMAPAAEAMEERLQSVALRAPVVPVISNVTAAPVSDPGEIRKLLIAQITAPVRWRESVQMMVARGVGEIWEVGAGRALSGMVRRIAREVKTLNIAAASDVLAAK